MPDLARYQRLAGEQVLEDEAWRDGLEDDLASRLLDWALARTDAALARAASAQGAAPDTPAPAAAAPRATPSAGLSEPGKVAQPPGKGEARGPAPAPGAPGAPAAPGRPASQGPVPRGAESRGATSQGAVPQEGVVQVPRALQDQALRELADAVAQQARRLLRVLAGRWRGEPESGVWQALEPLLGAPLFATPEEGQAALKEVLASASAVRAKA